MLGELTEAMQTHHRRRRLRRRVASSVGGLAVLALAAVAARGLLQDAPVTRPGSRVAVETPAAPKPSCEIRLVRTDPSILDRYRARPTRLVERLDDDGLLDELRRLDRPTGLVRVGGRAYLTASIADRRDRPSDL
jgi:hypothetical protein